MKQSEKECIECKFNKDKGSKEDISCLIGIKNPVEIERFFEVAREER